MAETVKDNWKLFELMPVAACVFERATLQHMCASYGVDRVRIARRVLGASA